MKTNAKLYLVLNTLSVRINVSLRMFKMCVWLNVTLFILLILIYDIARERNTFFYSLRTLINYYTLLRGGDLQKL